MKSAVKILCLSQKQLFYKISLNHLLFTSRCADIMANYIDNSLNYKSSDIVFYSITIDGNTDLSNSAQLAMFV